MNGIHGKCGGAAGDVSQTPAAAVVAIRKLISGFVSSQKSNNTRKLAMRRPCTADTSSAARMGSVAISTQSPGAADLQAAWSSHALLIAPSRHGRNFAARAAGY